MPRTKRITLPVRGLTNSPAFIDVPAAFAPPGSLKNVRPDDVVKEHGRLDQRPGWTYRFDQQLADGAQVQGMGVCSRVETVTGYRLGDCFALNNDGVNDSKLTAIVGQAWLMDNNLSMIREWKEDVTASGASEYGPDSAATNPSVNACAISPDNTTAYIAESYVVGGNRVIRITAINLTNWAAMLDSASTTEINAAVLWTRKIASAGEDVFVNQLTATVHFVFVASGAEVLVLKALDGTNATQASFDCGGWSQEVIGTAISHDGLSMFVLFLGAGYAETLDTDTGNTSGAGKTVAFGRNANHFRAGVMKCTLGGYIGSSDANTALIRTSFSTQLSPSDQYYEGGMTSPHSPHGYCRFSEKFAWKPRGAFPTGIAATPDGGFVVTHASGAWGPANTDTPIPVPACVTKFTAAGDVEWQAPLAPPTTEDRDADGFYNDLPGDSTETCTAHAVAVDRNGDIYVGGRVNVTGTDGINCYKLDGTDGTVLWTLRLGDSGVVDSIRENGIAIDNISGNPIFCGDRSTGWTGGTGAINAHIWKRRAADGGSIAYFDLGSALSALGVASIGTGEILYVSDLK